MKIYLETYGCQMNVNDSEVILAILKEHGWTRTENMDGADLILVNTCSVRDNAEQRILGRLDRFRLVRRSNPDVVVGIVGCMAERLKEKLISDGKVDLVCGPDCYRRLPSMLEGLDAGKKGGASRDGKASRDVQTVAVELSRTETYADIRPERLDPEGISAFISIMRGCNNVCSYCVVPYTRGVERSRDPESILAEARDLCDRGYRELTLLGQNVDSYRWKDASGEVIGFDRLLGEVAAAVPSMRIRFSTSNPHDLSDSLLHTMASFPNICRHIHLPVQSGSNVMLEKMRRKYTREWYLERVAKIREILPDCGLSTDVIAGFCGETIQDHEDTLSLMDSIGFDSAFMFQYSERPGTLASRKYPDDVPGQEKTRRLNEIIEHQMRSSAMRYGAMIGRELEVLVEGPSKKSPADLCGRASNNMMCVFTDRHPSVQRKGCLLRVKVTGSTAATLLCEEL